MVGIWNIFSQLGNVENIVDIFQFRGQAQSICYWVHFFNDLIGSYVSRTQFASNIEFPNPFDWRYLQEYLISDLEFQWSPPLICITFLTALGGFDILLNPLNFFSGFMDQFWPKD